MIFVHCSLALIARSCSLSRAYAQTSDRRAKVHVYDMPQHILSDVCACATHYLLPCYIYMYILYMYILYTYIIYVCISVKQGIINQSTSASRFTILTKLPVASVAQLCLVKTNSHASNYINIYTLTYTIYTYVLYAYFL